MTTQLPQQPPNNNGLIRQHIARQQTLPHRIITLSRIPKPTIVPAQTIPPTPEAAPLALPKIGVSRRVIAIALVGILALSIYLIWRPSAPAVPPAAITQQFSNGSVAITSTTLASVSSPTTNNKIQVYIVGAVKHPGVYVLESSARIYQLLQVAGGPLPGANLVALNLAAHLNDGQEIYVTQIGETPPAYGGSVSGTTLTAITPTTGSQASTTGTTGTAGQQVNLNTASADTFRQSLHISSATAQAIIGYRVQHGPFTSVDQLLQVVSKTIYNKIKNQVTVG